MLRVLGLLFFGFVLTASPSDASELVISGRALRADRPVSGARVELWDRTSPLAPVSVATTSSTGDFHLAAPSPAFWQVSAHIDGESFLLDVAPQGRSFHLPLLLTLGDGSQAGWKRGLPEYCKDLPLRKPFEVETEESPARPISGALLYWETLPCSARLTDAAGRAELALQPPGSSLKVVATGFTSLSAESGRIRLAPALAELRGSVVDSADQPIESALVVVPFSGSDPDAFTYTDSAGMFRLQNLPRAEGVVVRVAHPEYESQEWMGPLPPKVVLYRSGVLRGRLIDAGGRSIVGAQISVRIGKKSLKVGRSLAEGELFFEALPVEKGLTLEAVAPGFAKASRILKISSTGIDIGDWELAEGALLRRQVVDASGRGISGAKIFQIDPEVRKSSLEVPPPVAETARTGAAGYFQIAGLAARSPLALEVRAPFFQPLLLSASSPYEISNSIVLEKAASVSGRVQDQDGNAVGGAVVLLAPLGSDTLGAETRTDETGAFLLEPLHQGQRRLEVQSAFYLPFEQWLEIPPEGIRELEVKVDSGFSLKGRVLGPQGQPLAGAYVSWASAADHPGAPNASTDRSGNFVLDTLPPGPGKLEAFSQDFGRTSQSLVLQGDIEGWELRLESGKATDLEVLLLAESGQKVEGAQVSLDPADGPGIARRGVSDTSGEVKLSGLPPGSYRLRISDDRFIDAEAIVEIPHPEKLVLRLEMGASLTGTLTGLRPEDLADLSVYAVQGTRFARARWNPGRALFLLNGLLPGDWRIVFELPLRGRRVYNVHLEHGSSETLELSWDTLPAME